MSSNYIEIEKNTAIW